MTESQVMVYSSKAEAHVSSTVEQVYSIISIPSVRSAKNNMHKEAS